MKQKHFKKKKGNNHNAHRVDIDKVYRCLKENIAQRIELQKRKDYYYSLVFKTHTREYASTIEKIVDLIGKCTFNIDNCISELCKYNKSHVAMNLACLFLIAEIKRTRQIVSSNMKIASKVDKGLDYYESQYGERFYDSEYQRSGYIPKKQKRLAKLEKWLSHVSKYIVK